MRTILLALTLSACVGPMGGRQAPDADLAIAGVAVVDVERGRVQRDQTVLISGDRIVAVGSSSRVRVPEQAQVVQATGKYLIPGLWDMHVHAWQRSVFEPLLLANGILGIREMGTGIDPLWGGSQGVWSWREASRSPGAVTPRVVAPGFILNGGDPADAPVAFFKGVPTPEAGRAWVDSLAARQADFIKVYTALSPQVYAAIVRRARERELAVAGHVPARVGAPTASDMGQRSFEHLDDLLVATSSDERLIREEFAAILDTTTTPGSAIQLREIAITNRLLRTHSPEKAEALISRLARNQTWQVPTLVAMGGRHCTPLPLEPDSLRMQRLPAALHAFVQVQPATPAETARECRRYAKLVELVRAMYAAGVPILAGSDAPNPSVFPGSGLHDELALLVHAGMTPADALRAATIEPARYLGLDGELGTVESGKVANLVLLDGDPLSDIANTRTVDGVIVNGKLWAGPDRG